MTSEGLGDMFKGDLPNTSLINLRLCQACADRELKLENYILDKLFFLASIFIFYKAANELNLIKLTGKYRY